MSNEPNAPSSGDLPAGDGLGPWLDQVLAVPAVGIRIEQSFSRAIEHVRAVSDLVDEILDDQEEEVQFKTPDACSVEFVSRAEGLRHRVGQSYIIVEYGYSVQQEREAGKLPSLPGGRVEPFSRLMRVVIDRALRVFSAVSRGDSLKVVRIGLLASARLDPDSLPPGLTTWIEHMARPWQGSLISAAPALLAKLHETESERDQCHHLLKFNTAEKILEYELKLDWQRILTPPRELSAKRMESAIDECRRCAFAYYDRFAEGDLNYE